MEPRTRTKYVTISNARKTMNLDVQTEQTTEDFAFQDTNCVMEVMIVKMELMRVKRPAIICSVIQLTNFDVQTEPLENCAFLVRVYAGVPLQGTIATAIALDVLMVPKIQTTCATLSNVNTSSSDAQTEQVMEDFAFKWTNCVMESMIARMEQMSLSMFVMPSNADGTNFVVLIARQENFASTGRRFVTIG